LTEVVGLRAAGLSFASLVAGLAATVLALLARDRTEQKSRTHTGAGRPALSKSM
jgi:multisubunit Na+/H+ antiporter MnhB subunit